MNENTNIIDEQNDNLTPVQKITPFTRMIMTIGTLPSSFYSSMTYYESMVWLYEYLKNTVIPTVNNNAEAVEELQNAYITLKNYIDTYFDNLDVQEEVNKKLDEMAEDGTLTNLISTYIDPIVTNQNNKILQIENTVNSVASGSPAGVYDTVSDLTTADPDHSKIYLVLADGKWYYYNTSESSWTGGGVYQSSPTVYDTTLTLNNATPNSRSVGDKLNKIVYTKNLLNLEDIMDNKIIYSNGTINDNVNFFVSNIFKVKQGDRILAQYFDNNLSKKRQINAVIKVQADGTFISLTSNSDQPYWTADADCFVRLNLPKSGTQTAANTMITLNTPTNSYQSYNYNLIQNEDEINEISEYVNVFNINDYINNESIDANGNLTPVDHYFSTNLIPCKSGDIIYTKYHDDNVTNVKIANVFKYDENMQIIGRSTVNNSSYTATANGYVKFTCQNPNDSILNNKFTISINRQLSNYIPYRRYLIPNDESGIVNISKVDSTNYDITFGKFKITLFKTVDASSNSNNWNIKNLRDINDNIMIPQGTDILGPVQINSNSDFIGGVHGNETTNYITVSINGTSYDLSTINSLDGNTLTININSTCYDEDDGLEAFQRYITLIFSDNKLHVSNNYKASRNLTLKRATNGGLIACRNNIIKNIMFNNSYFNIPPSSSVSNASNKNTMATINTQYGSITVYNIIGYENPNYIGFLNVFTNETPMRCKVYFDTYKSGTYSINQNDLIVGEFEYTLS